MSYAAPLLPEVQRVSWKVGFRSESPAARRGVEKDDLTAKEAAKEKLNFHSLRHSCAAHILRETGNIFLVSQLLGHGSVKITRDHYEHFTPNNLQAGVGAAFETNRQA